ncbi:MAG: recombinase family protein [Mycobacteriales bacterium]
MTTPVRAVAIYARISSDQDGTTLGVQRQLEDCRKLAADLGWPVADEYVDNDVSAYSGKRRPEYERMLSDLADGSRDAVLVYHVDRLTRRPIELEQFLDVLTAARVRQVRFVAGGDLDVGNGDGLMVLRMLLAVAANESATKSRRVKRKMLQNAEAGLPHGGYQRPFGFDEDKITVREDEAQVIRALAERFLAGESLRSLATWLDEQGVATVSGKPWRTPTLRALLASGRVAGLRDHQGQVIGKAVWEPIITEQTRARILSRMAEQKTSGRRSPRRYLLSGLLRCHRCGHTLYSAAREDVRRYVCSSGPDHGGCGGTFVVAGPVEDLIAQAVLFRLDTPELADALAGRAAADERTAALAQALAEDQQQLAELTALYAAKSITAREWMEARNPIQARISKAEQAIARATRSDALAGLVGNGEQLRAAWAGLNLTRQAAIVRAVLDHAVIGPGTRGAQSFDAARVQPVWRL